jgi:hypothetical protein
MMARADGQRDDDLIELFLMEAFRKRDLIINRWSLEAGGRRRTTAWSIYWAPPSDWLCNLSPQGAIAGGEDVRSRNSR